MHPGHTIDDSARAAETELLSYAERFFSSVSGYAAGAQVLPSWEEGNGYIARGQERAFESDMVFHLPLCLRHLDRWGIGLSDTDRDTPQGGEPLTDNDW